MRRDNEYDLYTGLLLNQAASLASSPEHADFYEFYTSLFDQVELALADPFWAPLPGLDGAALAQDLARIDTMRAAGSALLSNQTLRALAAAGGEKIMAACRFSLESGSSIVVSG